jgi:hypothetical protein
VEHAPKRFETSERRACRVLKQLRSSQRYFGKKVGNVTTLL